MGRMFQKERSSDLAHVVESMAREIEKLHSLIEGQRQLLKGSADPRRAHRKQARRQLNRIRASAVEVADRAREAIHEVTQTA
jgi:hypothetical protein